MATNTSKSIPARSNMPAKPKAVRAKPSEQAAPIAPAARKGLFVTIAGTGTIPITTNGARRRIPRGKPVEVTKAEKAVLVRNKVPHSKGK